MLKRAYRRMRAMAATKHPVVEALNEFVDRLTRQANMEKRTNPADAKELLSEVDEAKKLAKKIQELHDKHTAIQASEQKVRAQLTEAVKQASSFVTISKDKK